MFTNPVVGGTTLIRPAIQSPNFVHLSSGWTINQDGSAEFNNVAIRGTLTVTGPSTLGGTLTMSGGACILTAASPNQRISICSTPANAISFFSGDVTETSPGTLQVLASGGSGQLSLQAPKFSGTGTNAGTLLLGNDGTWTLIGPGSTQFSSTVFNELSGTQLRLLVGNASLGQSVPHGTPFAEFRNSFSNAGGTYCLLQQNDGTTYLNAASGKILYVRNNNADVAQFIGPSGDFQRLNIFTGADAGTWDQRVLRLHAPSRPGLTGFHTGSGAAEQWMDQGPRWDSTDSVGNGFPIGASSFVTISRLATKIPGSIRPLDAAVEREKIRSLRPIRFQRPHGFMHVPCNGIGCVDCSDTGIPGQINRPFIDKNQDTDFLGFIAEEVAEHYPELINWEPSDPDDWHSEARPGGVDLGAMTALLLTTIHDVLDRIEILEGKS